jgi:hypothetical protein
MGRSGWGGIFNVLPLISWPPLRFIQQCRRRPDWTLMDIEQPPIPCHDAIHRSGWRRVRRYRGDAMWGNIDPVPSDLPAASSFNSTMPPPK